MIPKTAKNDNLYFHMIFSFTDGKKKNRSVLMGVY